MTNVQANWEELHRIIRLTLVSGVTEYRDMLVFFQDDRVYDTGTVLGMKRAPASASVHHAREGGLVQHLLEMWGLWMSLRGVITLVEDERALRAIINHDIHKAAWNYKLISTEPWSVDYNPHNPGHKLMTKDVHSLHILHTHRIPMDEELVNALLLAEGGFSKIRPEWDSVLAKTVYVLDELSANIVDRIRTNDLLHIRNQRKPQ